MFKMCYVQHILIKQLLIDLLDLRVIRTLVLKLIEDAEGHVRIIEINLDERLCNSFVHVGD